MSSNIGSCDSFNSFYLRGESSASTSTSTSSSSSSSPAQAPSTSLTPISSGASVLSQEYTFRGKPFGTETIERVPSILILVDILEKKKAYPEKLGHDTTAIELTLKNCQDALNGRSHIPAPVKDRIRELEKRRDEDSRTSDDYIWGAICGGTGLPLSMIRSMQITREQLKEIQNQLKFDWIGSNYFRDCLVDCEAMGDLDGKIAEEAYEELVKNIIPAPVNLRRHEAIDLNGDKTTMIRVGVMSDMRNGYFSLYELNRMLKNNTLRADKYEELNTQIQNLEEIYGDRSTPELVVLKYAAKQLQTENFQEVIKERASFLENQMLMLVLEHLKTAQKNNSEFKHLKTLPIMHLCLLNQKTNKVDKTGWKKNEEVFMCDMKEMFTLFANKKLVFDGTGPFIDNDGDIHLPADFGIRSFPKSSPAYLKTFFSNVSVQGNTENNETQSMINDDFFQKLKKHYNGQLPLEFEQLHEKLHAGQEDAAVIAEELASAAVKNDLYLSVGCLSAKDRTGLVCGRVCVNHTLENSQLTEKEKKKAEKLWSESILEGPNLEVCKECNIRCLEPKNVLALKLVGRNLPGVGGVKRAGHMVKLVQMVFRSKSKKAEEEKISSPRTVRRGGLTGHSSRFASRNPASVKKENFKPTVRSSSSASTIASITPRTVVIDVKASETIAQSISSASSTAPATPSVATGGVKAKVAFFKGLQDLQATPFVRDSSVVDVKMPIASGNVKSKRALFFEPK